jgi:hypothetical protein
MKSFKYSHLSIPALLTLALTSAACKNDCDKAKDHVARLSARHVQLEDKEIQALPPEARAQVDKVLKEVETAPVMRELAAKRLGARCQDPAFTKCVLAAKDIWGVAECEHPTTPEELGEANKALEKLRAQ